LINQVKTMSRIQQILDKAEREGLTRRTRALSSDEAPVRPAGEMGDPVGAVREPPPRPTPPPVTPELPPAAALDALNRVENRQVTLRTAAGAILDPMLVAAVAPVSLAAEQYRSLRMRINRLERHRSVKTMLVTSPGKGDGKSITAANLALTMAQEFHARVLLIDADLRRSRLHSLLGLGSGAGLCDVLVGAASVEDVMVWLPEHRLTVIPAGLSAAHPAELLGSATMRTTLESLRTKFDRIVIDTPPIAPLADVGVLAPLVDGVVLIVRAGVTPRPAIERALTAVEAPKLLGLVLNDVGESAKKYYAQYGYGYGKG
jgi:protein-tyrosine kinase